MLSLTSNLKIFVYLPHADMRKGIDGLSGLVRSEFKQSDPTDGSLYLFINRRRDRLKILHFDGAGYWLYYRVLESGTFETIRGVDTLQTLQLDATQLTMLLSGVSLVASQRRRKRFRIASQTESGAGAA